MVDQDGWSVHVVDDDEAVRESLEALLRVSGFAVATYGSAADFLERAPAAQGCVLLDIHMPGMNGLDLLAHLLGIGVRLPVLMLTASRENRLRERALALGACGFLTKPVTETALLGAIQAVRTKPAI